MRTHLIRRGIRAAKQAETPEQAADRFFAEHARYEAALRRIAESDDAACPHVAVALEALNPSE